MKGWKVDIWKATLGWMWEVYHSGYGLQGGLALTRRSAIRKAKKAISEFIMEDWND